MKSLRQIIKEEILKEINDVYGGKSNLPQSLLNKVWSNGFTLREFVSFDNSSDRLRYCENTLSVIGYGKRRTVFKLNDKYILKITNGSHRFQSKNEYDSSFLMTDRTDLFPRMLYQSPDFSWSINEYAKPLTNEDCERILGIPLYSDNTLEPSLEGFQIWAETQGRQPSRQTDSKVRLSNKCDTIYRNLLKSNPWFKTFYKLELSQRGDLDYGTDLNPTGYDFRSENLGYVNRNGKDFVVILDGGFIKPFDTRKLKSRYNVNSPQINDNFY